jgi:hypothetical protein
MGNSISQFIFSFFFSLILFFFIDELFYFFFFSFLLFQNLKFEIYSLMSAKFEKSLKEEKWMVNDDEANKVLTSSRDLIFYFKQSMKRCSAISKQNALYEMFKLFKKYLCKYVDVLKGKLPR